MSAATGILDGDDGFGHLAGYRAIEEGMKLAESSGIGAVTVTNSSHFGAAGSYPLMAAERGYLALALSNSDNWFWLMTALTLFMERTRSALLLRSKIRNPT